MRLRFLALLSLILLLNKFSFGQVEENHVDFTISPAVISEGNIQVAFEWISQSEFRKRNLSLLDLPKINEFNPKNNQMIASKLVFVTKKPFGSLSHARMNTGNYISELLNSTRIEPVESDLWFVTNKVKAYKIPFKISFNLKFREIESSVLAPEVLDYLRNESSALKGTGRERFMILDMTNFSHLMYQNYSIIYMKEVSPSETMIVSGVIAGFNINMANTFFNIPPFSTTRGTMMGNMKRQIIQMAEKIQHN